MPKHEHPLNPKKNFRHISEEYVAKVDNSSFRMNGRYIRQVAWPKIAEATRGA